MITSSTLKFKSLKRGLLRKKALAARTRSIREQVSSVRGFSIIEILIVLFIFSILGVVVTRILALSLRSTGKSESVGVVKENVEYAASVMERLLRNAKSVTLVSSSQIDYVDADGAAGRLSCIGNDNGYIASGSASPVRITSSDIKILCLSQPVFTYDVPTQNVPGTVTFTIKANHAVLGSYGSGAEIVVKSRVQLRNY